MKDFRKNFKDGLAKTSQFLKYSSEEAAAKIKEGAEKISSMGPVAKDKVINVVNDVVAILPLLEEAGYRTNEFKIGVSIAPVMEISFSKFLDVPEETLDKLKIEHQNKKMFNMIFGMLNTANNLSAKLEADDFSFYETVVEIAIPPKVSLRYVHKKVEPSLGAVLNEEE